MCCCFLSLRVDVSFEMPKLLLDLEEISRSKMTEELCLSCPIHFCSLCSVPTVNLELELTYFSDFEDAESRLS